MKKWLVDFVRDTRQPLAVFERKPQSLAGAGIQFARAHFFARWQWRFDGRLAAFIFLVYLFDRIGPSGLFKETASLLAILSFGVILKRNLRRDVKWKELPGALRNSRSR